MTTVERLRLKLKQKEEARATIGVYPGAKKQYNGGSSAKQVDQALPPPIDRMPSIPLSQRPLFDDLVIPAIRRTQHLIGEKIEKVEKSFVPFFVNCFPLNYYYDIISAFNKGIDTEVPTPEQMEKGLDRCFQMAKIKNLNQAFVAIYLPTESLWKLALNKLTVSYGKLAAARRILGLDPLDLSIHERIEEDGQRSFTVDIRTYTEDDTGNTIQSTKTIHLFIPPRPLTGEELLDLLRKKSKNILDRINYLDKLSLAGKSPIDMLID